MFIPPIIAGLISFLLTPFVIRFARRCGALDVPKDDRRMHALPMPLWGGIAIFFAFFIPMFLFSKIGFEKLLGLLLASIVVVVMGLIDDVRPLNAKLKFIIQIVAALILVQAGFTINYFTNFFGGSGYIYLGVWSIPITVIWIVGVTNTVNLIDGLDGLAAGISAIAAITLSYVAILNHRYDAAMATLILAGSSIGFLPYNFNPAKIFMGDAGALFLGLVLAAISTDGAMKGATLLTVLVPILAIGVPIFDTAFAILRRMIQGKPIMEADKGHLHHRLMGIGLGQRKTVLSMYLINVLLGAGAVSILQKNWTHAGVLLGLAIVSIVIPVFRSKHRDSH